MKEVESITMELLAKDEIRGDITEKNVSVSNSRISEPSVVKKKAETVKRQFPPKEEGESLRVRKGEPIEIPDVETKKCPFCGASVEAGVKSCPKCGRVLL